MRLPLTVIGGYLGAGKTTLINRLLGEDHGLRLLVLVNDFGAINIDANLLASADADTIALTNGCVCCTMGADLFMTIGDILDRPDRPDHLIIEASGIADPAAIANVANAEPDLSYAGIVTVVDARQIQDLLNDDSIGPQIARQIAVADLLVLSKTEKTTENPRDHLRPINTHAPIIQGDAPISRLLWEITPRPFSSKTPPHPAYTAWYCEKAFAEDRRSLQEKLDRRPAGIYRLKGFVETREGPYQVQIVGRVCEMRAIVDDTSTGLVALGLADRVTEADIEQWWRGATDQTAGVRR